MKDLVRDYLKKFPTHADMTLAKLIYKEHSILFTSLDACRNMIRYQRGHLGEHNRENMKDKTLVKPVTYNTNPYKLPESDEKIREPFILPKANNNILLISDLHIPYHSIDAITAALDYGKKEEVNTVVINGDLIDCMKISRFETNPAKRDMRGEFDATKEFLIILRATFPNAGIYWLKGNHDVRYEHYLMAKAPEIFNDPYYLLEERLRLNEQRVHLINDKTLMKAGKLFIHHGHVFFRGFGAPVNAARGLFLKTKHSAIVGHCHRVSEHSEVSLDGSLITCWSTGCLAEISPDYSPFGSNYSHGFAHIKVDNQGNYSVKNFRIKNGKIL